MYTRKYRIERFDADKQGRLSVPTLFSYLNDIMERNAESYGMGASYHLERDLAWVLVEYQIDIASLPEAGTHVEVGTLPYSFKKIYGYRIYGVNDDHGVRLMEGKGKFALINIRTKQFVRPTEDLLEKFTDAHKEPMSIPFERWKPDTTNKIHETKRVVSPAHIDVNGHLNNAFYPTYAYEALSEDILTGFSPNRIYVKYKKEVFANEMLDIKVYQESDGISVLLHNGNGIVSEVFFGTK